MFCNCPRCERLKFLQAKESRAEQILESGEGVLSLWLVDGKGGFENLCIPAHRKGELRRALDIIKQEIESLSKAPHQMRRMLRTWVK